MNDKIYYSICGQLNERKKKKMTERNDRWMKDKTQLTDECINIIILLPFGLVS